MAEPIIQLLTGVILIIHCSYLVIPKLYSIEIEVNNIKGKYVQSLNDSIFKNYLQEARWGFPMRYTDDRPHHKCY